MKIWELDLKGSGMSNDKKAREGDGSDAPMKDNTSERESKCAKFSL